MIRGTRIANLHRTPLLATLVVAVVACAPTAVRGDEPDVIATERGVEDLRELKFTSKGQGEFTRHVGLITWTIPVTNLPTMGLERVFKSFCAEPLLDVNPGVTYGFMIDPIEKPSNYNLPDDENGRNTAQRKAKLLRELFGRYYADTLPGSKAGPDARGAFQTAVWKVFEEKELPDGPMPLNMFTGTFQANYPREADAPPFVQLAQQYVTSLSGNDAVFKESPDFAGMELVRMTGMIGSNGMVAQSQLAFRMQSGAGDTGGGGTGIGATTPIASALGPSGVGPIIPTTGVAVSVDSRGPCSPAAGCSAAADPRSSAAPVAAVARTPPRAAAVPAGAAQS